MLGQEHPDTLTTRHSLALIFADQHKYEDAEDLYGHTLELREKVLGQEDTSMYCSVYCLAYMFQRQRRYRESCHFYQRAYAGFRNTLGEGHSDTLACLKEYTYVLKELEQVGNL